MINLKEKIKAIQEKYKKEEEEYCNNGYGEAEYQSLGFLDLDEDVSDQTDEKFKHIYDNLLPCKTELYNLEEELRNLKRKIKTPKELIEQEKRVNQNCDFPVIDNNIFDIAKDITKHINKDSFKANEDDIKHMVCDSEGRTYRVHIPATVLDLDNLDDDFIMNNDTVICKVRDGVMTRVTMNRSDDNELTIAGGNMMNRLGLTRKDLQVCIDHVVRDSTGEELELVGERVVELIRNKKRILTRIVFVSSAGDQNDNAPVTGIHLSWYAASLLKIF